MKVYQRLAECIAARRRCSDAHNMLNWDALLRNIVDNYLPSGSGVDNGTKIAIDECHADRIVLSAGYHHMNDAGMYDGWTEHNIVIKPTFSGIDVTVTGRDRNDIKEYLGELYYNALTQNWEK